MQPFCTNSTIYVSHRFHLAFTLKSLLLSSLVGFCLVVFCVGVLFVVWHIMQETLSKTAQADLCISCMNGGSTRAKKHEELVSWKQSQQGLDKIDCQTFAARSFLIVLHQQGGVMVYLSVERQKLRI